MSNKQKLIFKKPREQAAYLTVNVRHALYYDLVLKEYIYDESPNAWKTIIKNQHNVFTNAGRDLLHAQLYVNTSAGTRGAGYIALTETAITPAATDTSLSGEITTNGLARTDAGTKTHTTGTNSTLIEHTFTASGTFSTVQGSGLFNASSGVTLVHIATMTSTALVSGDQIKVSWTVNAG